MHEIVIEGRGPNTLSLAMLERLEAELEAAGDAPLLVRGAGEAFSSGLDLDALAALDEDGLARLLRTMERAVQRLFLHPAPTVAMIGGHAVAGGCLLAQCCDVRIVVDDPRVRLGMTGVALGLVYPPFVAEVFRARLAPPQAEAVLLSARRVDVREALALGLVDRVVHREALRAECEAALRERADLPRAAYAAAKRSLRTPAPRDPEATARAFYEELLPSWVGLVKRGRPPTAAPR